MVVDDMLAAGEGASPCVVSLLVEDDDPVGSMGVACRTDEHAAAGMTSIIVMPAMQATRASLRSVARMCLRLPVDNGCQELSLMLLYII
ncbi:hypothetical protein [Bifidobacterium aquikefiri]|uniref:hypothetical protein n=1 Tax=Bifidobacterium aquikefiri TaxID=1653207 RepID=UPI0039EAF3D9